MTYTTLTFNLQNAPIRRATLQGKVYIVAPTAMLTEGVHAGSGGPLLYRENECKKAIPAWNMKPIVVYHPQINGQGVSACDPTILEAQQVGMLLNTCWKDKLRTEAWIDEARAAKVDDRVLTALERNQVMEVSTGLFTKPKGGPGEWNGVAYNAEATNHQPDHLALLPDKIGACSVADGAGLLQLNEAATASGFDATRLLAREFDMLRRMVGNAISHSNIHAALMRALKERAGEGAWVVDVYDDFLVYDMEGDSKVFKLYYTMTDGGVEITGEPEEVVKITEYRTPEGSFVGNENHIDGRSDEMKKSEVIDALIANAGTQWTEDDREALTGLDEGVLNKLAPVTNEDPLTDGGDTGDTGDTGDDKPKETLVGDTPAEDPAAPVTMEQYLAAAPAEVRGPLTNAIATYNTAKQGFIANIMANKQNKFSAKFLATKDVDELQGMVALCGNTEEAIPAPVPMFTGQAIPTGVAPVANEVADEEPLATPTMNFEKVAV